MTQATDRSFPRNASEEVPFTEEQAGTRIDEIFDALFTTSEGSVAPTSPGTGMQWLDTSVTPYRLRLWDGTQWAIVAYIDPATGAVTPFTRAYTTVRGIATGTGIPSGVATKIVFLTEGEDVSSAYASGTYTAATSGLHLIHATVTLPGQASGFASSVDLYVNGAAARRGDTLGGSTFSGTRTHLVREMIRLTAGNTVDIYATQTSGSTITVSGTDAGVDRWGFEAVRLA